MQLKYFSLEGEDDRILAEGPKPYSAHPVCTREDAADFLVLTNKCFRLDIDHLRNHFTQLWNSFVGIFPLAQFEKVGGSNEVKHWVDWLAE